MKCVRCQNNPATVKLTRIVKGKVMELNLCQSCAAEVSPYQKKLAAAQGLNALIAHLFKAEQAKKQEESGEQGSTVDLKCPACGLVFQTYKRTLMLGCEQCYETFGDALLTDLRKIHGSVHHAGRASEAAKQTAPPPKGFDQLRAELQQAIDAEDFERASRIRDQIRAMQGDS